ncbi:MAG: septum formation initiator family protein [Chloroherpetonaceae bacterium]|nr:septum formation initiator family protein [Chthonomonadaceae bacterium]MDW8207071.1 septum formation initiator family protein [Chloroherpetonaceae bacterium]
MLHASSGALICSLFVWLGVQAAYPFRLAAQLRQENDAIEREVHRYRLQNQRLQREVEALSTREGVIRAARRYGWVLPGETRLLLPSAPVASGKP